MAPWPSGARQSNAYVHVLSAGLALRTFPTDLGPAPTEKGVFCRLRERIHSGPLNASLGESSAFSGSGFVRDALFQRGAKYAKTKHHPRKSMVFIGSRSLRCIMFSGCARVISVGLAAEVRLLSSV